MRLRATRLFSMANPNGAGVPSGPVPTLDLDFLAMAVAGTLDPRITYTRTGNASVIDSSGAMQIVAANVPRFDFDPVTLAPEGIIAEPAATNLLLNSATLVTQSVTVTAAAHTLSFYGSGTVVLSGTASATVVGTGAYPSRTTFTFTPTAGTLTLTVTGTVQWANLELGTRASSWIPTGGTTATRGGDIANIAGTNFSSIYNPTEGTLVIELAITNAGATSAQARAGSIGGTASRVADMFYGMANWQNYNGSTGMSVSGAPSLYTVNKVAATYKSGAYNFAANGVLATPRTDALLNTPNVMGIGNLAGGSQAFGRIRRLRYYNTALTGAELQSLTAP